MVFDKLGKGVVAGESLCSYCENSLYILHEGVFHYLFTQRMTYAY